MLYTKTNICSDEFNNLDLKTFENQSIYFQLTSFNPNLNEIQKQGDILENSKSFYVIEAIVNNQKAGYLLLGFISNKFKEKFLNNPLDWYVHRYGNTQLKKDWLIDHSLGFKSVANILQTEIPINLLQNEIYDFLNNIVSTSSLGLNYQSYLNYWLDKPNVEYSCVYSKDDEREKNFGGLPFDYVKRKSLTNFRGLGIAQKLYWVGSKLIQTLDLQVYSSNTQTADGKKIWVILENLPNFQIISDAFLTTTTTNRKNLILEERKKILVK